MRISRFFLPFLLAFSVAIPPLAGHAATVSVSDLFPNGCPAYGDMHVCSSWIPSYDTAPLDVDLTLPINGGGQRHPLIVMLHGFANNKHEWESVTDVGDNADKWHWNSHWFAEHGFYVLTYTARGFRDDGRTDKSYQPPTPCGNTFVPDTSCNGSVSPKGRINLKYRGVPSDPTSPESGGSEVQDTQYLAALVAAAFPDIDTNRLAVTGGSYGGGESWLQAAQADWTFGHSINPDLPVLHLQVAIPKYPWTDLAYSLAPNGHPGPFDASIYSSSQGIPSGTPPAPDTQGNPLGTVKYSYVAGFFLEGVATGAFETRLAAWFNRIAIDGDLVPYDGGAPGTDDLTVADARRGLTEERSSYYQDDDGWSQQRAGREVAIFSVSGWTDFLFPPVEAFRQFKYLKSLDRLWPVELAIADVGHPPAQNKPAQWQRLNDQAWQFLKSQLNGSHREQTTVASMPTICPQSGDTNLDAIQRLTGRTPEDLSNGTLTVNYLPGGNFISNWHVSGTSPLNDVVADPDNLVVDPVLGTPPDQRNTCRVSVTNGAVHQPVRYTGISQPISNPRIYIGLGHVDIDHYELVGKTATLDARVWDVSPNGTQLLMTRGTYRIDPPVYDVPGGSLELPLFGNQWTLDAGHQIRLDLTLVDSPSFMPSNQPATTLSFGPPRLVLPTREATEVALAGTTLP